MISQTESITHLIAATAISTALLGIGLHGSVRQRKSDLVPKRHMRGVWILAGLLGSLMTVFVAYTEATRNPHPPTEIAATGAFIIGGFVLGAVLLMAGLRGRWVGDHSHCRACGFDLFGKPAESNICNECGGDLTAPRATVIGVRNRRLMPMLVGAFLITLCLATGVSIGSEMLRSSGQFTLTPYKPTWWLILQLRSSDDYLIERELYARLRDGKLDDAAVKSVVLMGDTAAGGSAACEWFAAPFAFEAWSRGQLDEATVRQFLRQALTFDSVIADESTPKTIAYGIRPSSSILNAFAGSTSGSAAMTVQNCHIEVNGAAVPVSCVSKSVIEGPAPIVEVFGNVLRMPTPLPVGDATVKMTLDVSLMCAVPGRAPLTETVPIVLIDKKTRIVAVLDSFARATSENAATDMGFDNMTATISLQIEADSTTHASIVFSSNVDAEHYGMFTGYVWLCSNGSEQNLGPIMLYDGSTRFEATLSGASPASAIQLKLKPSQDLAAELTSRLATYPSEILIAAPTVERLPAH